MFFSFLSQISRNGKKKMLFALEMISVARWREKKTPTTHHFFGLPSFFSFFPVRSRSLFFFLRLRLNHIIMIQDVIIFCFDCEAVIFSVLFRLLQNFIAPCLRHHWESLVIVRCTQWRSCSYAKFALQGHFWGDLVCN